MLQTLTEKWQTSKEQQEFTFYLPCSLLTGEGCLKKIPHPRKEELDLFQGGSSLRTADVSPRLSPLRDVLWGGTSATQRQKFHTDDVNQCLHNKFGSHGVPNANLFNSTFLLVDFGKVLCSSSNELQQNSNASSREDYIPQILAVLLEIHRVYIWPLRSFVCHS